MDESEFFDRVFGGDHPQAAPIDPESDGGKALLDQYHTHNARAIELQEERGRLQTAHAEVHLAHVRMQTDLMRTLSGGFALLAIAGSIRLVLWRRR